MQNRVVKASLFLLACLVVGIVAGVFSTKYYRAGPAQAPEITGFLWPNPKTIGPFGMINQDNELFSQKDLAGHWTFLFFGYTHCPDVCPITLSVMDQVYRQLQKNNQAGNVQMVFVSVDPQRDTPDKMASYMDYFNRDFVGLTGSQEQLESIARQMGIVYVHADESASGEYLVDHTASIFLVSPEKQLIGIFSAPHDKQDIIDRFLKIRNFIGNQAS